MASPVRSPIYLLQPLPAEVPALQYWTALGRHRSLLVLVAMLGALVGLGWVILRGAYFCAHAVIRPVEGTDLSSQLGASSSLLGLNLGGKSEAEAYRFMSMIGSRRFLWRLIGEHDLATQPALFGGLHGARPLDRWAALRALSGATSALFDRREGNIVIEITLRDPTLARTILGSVITDLREDLRKHEIDDSEAAVVSLQQQIDHTPDPLLREQLYQQVAADLHRAALAKVQADFAFEIIDPPSVDPRPVGPGRVRAAAAGMLAGVLLGAILSWWRELSPSGGHGAAGGRR